MGITIDEHIGVIEDLKNTMSICMSEPEKTEICTSLSEAIETMHKYQKIQEIYDRFQKYGDNYHHMAWLDVMEVVKDGNVD